LIELPLPVSQDAGKFVPIIEHLKIHAREVLDTDAANYQASQASSSSSRFMSTIMSSGTQSDKVSALTLAIQESPAHNIRAFDNLIGLAGKNNRGQAIAALGAIVDLLGNGAVLPSDRRLRAFGSQPSLIGFLQDQELYDWRHGQNLPSPLTDEHLALWAFEDWLKDAYFRIIQLLEKWIGDEIVYSRQTTLDYVYGLLRDKPEQEANLLRLLVNKLGDKERKIASRASYLLLQLLTLHPGMKEIVITAVEQEVLLRPGQNIRTKYYAIITLNQTILSAKEPAVAEKLLRLYFDIFLSLLRTGALDAPSDAKVGEKHGRPATKNGKGRWPVQDVPLSDTETAQRLVSAVLTGVNRAVPFATGNNSILEEHLDTLFKITHSSNFNTSIQALMLIQQLAISRHLAVDRFFRTLYESLLDPRLIASSKQAMYLNLLFRSLKNDIDVRRVKAFVKRMLQTVHLHSAAFACGMLFLLSELEKTFPDIKTLINEPEEETDEEEEVFKDVVSAAPDMNGTNEVAVDGAVAKAKNVYDGRKRAPEHSNADRSCLWELVPFLRHFHPSVAILAANLITRQKALPKPELANHTIIHFLDKFVYRNPKSTETKRGTSIMQPVLAGGSSVQAVLPGRGGVSQSQTQVNSASFWNLKQDQIAAEDVFFHEYFAQVGKPGRAVKTKKQKADGEEQEGSLGGEEEGEDEIWQALVSSKPELDGINEDDGDDIDMDDLEDLDVAMDNLSDSYDDPGSEGSVGLQLDDTMSGDEDSASNDEEDETVDEGKGRPYVIGADKTNGRLKRKELKSLPTFASADDYADMLAGEDEI
jgi:ribosome biogenesis protein MAK21